ncbi:hypothetical protein E3N88_44359 [Mikania micrantha]|uniref:Gibberellin regulated protein n=1 Tax=Mikania micrantha TaxID=192012 RepID=A0A5N6LCA5_9ASTR|nr:hypothetical protein E3N88_44359 [Mikania micrantha]
MNHFRFSILLITTLLFFSSSIVIINSTITSMATSSSIGTFGFGCDEKCDNRCAKAGYKERCLKYCGICCEKCKGCVPSSPDADKAECPCYNDLKNSKGKGKCP